MSAPCAIYQNNNNELAEFRRGISSNNFSGRKSGVCNLSGFGFLKIEAGGMNATEE